MSLAREGSFFGSAAKRIQRGEGKKVEGKKHQGDLKANKKQHNSSKMSSLTACSDQRDQKTFLHSFREFDLFGKAFDAYIPITLSTAVHDSTLSNLQTTLRSRGWKRQRNTSDLQVSQAHSELGVENS